MWLCGAIPRSECVYVRLGSVQDSQSTDYRLVNNSSNLRQTSWKVWNVFYSNRAGRFCCCVVGLQSYSSLTFLSTSIWTELTWMLSKMAEWADISQIIRKYLSLKETQLFNQYGQITYGVKLNIGRTAEQLVQALHNPADGGFDSPWDHLFCQLAKYFQLQHVSGVDLSSHSNNCQERFWGKGRWVRKAHNLITTWQLSV